MNKIGVFYGSTTGTTEDLARRIAEKLDVPSAHIFEETAETIDIIEAERLVYFAYAHISGEHCTCLFKAHRIQVFDHRYAELLFKLCLEAVFIYVKSPGEMV